MSIISKLACSLGRNDEVPNQILAKELAEKQNKKDIRELADNLQNKDKNIQNDCIKVLYEIGYLKPELIAEHFQNFFDLLSSRNNRLVWGGMIALSTIAQLKADKVVANHKAILGLLNAGSVITVDNAVRCLARAASQKDSYREKILPSLFKHLETCRPKEVPMHGEFVSVAIDKKNQNKFIAILKKRQTEMTDAQKARINKMIKILEKK